MTNTKFSWKDIFRVRLQPKHSFTIHFFLYRQTEQKSKIERTARGGLKEFPDLLLKYSFN